MSDLLLEWYMNDTREVSTNSLGGKFVCAQKDGVLKLVLEDFMGANHSEIVQMLWDNGFDVKGGGRLFIFSADVEIEWDSHTMRTEFGFDRPKDKEESEELLGKLKKLLENMGS